MSRGIEGLTTKLLHATLCRVQLHDRMGEPMKCIKASGQCGLCGRYSEAIGADREDALILLNHEHGYEYKHVFHGEPTYREVERSEK